MSSEMRELAEEGLAYFERSGDEGDKKYVAAIRALLARTEAGADGAVAHIHDYGDRVRVVWDKPWGDFPVGTQFYTHPNDASGDAERFAFLASKAKQDRAYDVFGAGGHWGIGIHSDDGNLTFREAVDAAMQAKEAK